MTTTLTYTNKRGKEVELRLTAHARQRFIQRWHRINPDQPLDNSAVDREITSLFSRACRVTNLSYIERRRMNRYGKDTLLYRIDEFTFVIQASAVLTIEISDNDYRHYNRQRRPNPPPAVSPTPQPPSPTEKESAGWNSLSIHEYMSAESEFQRNDGRTRDL